MCGHELRVPDMAAKRDRTPEAEVGEEGEGSSPGLEAGPATWGSTREGTTAG